MKISLADRCDFYEKLSGLLSAGTSMQDSLNILHQQAESNRVTEFIEVILSGISQGKGFADSFLPHDNFLKNYEIPILRAGETSGRLDQVLLNMCQTLERELEIKKKIISQSKGQFWTIHCAIILFPLIEYFHQKELVIFLAKIIFPLSIIYSSIFFFYYHLRSKENKTSIQLRLEGIILRIPLLGTLVRGIDSYRFLYTYWLLNKSGLEREKTMEIAISVVHFSLGIRALGSLLEYIQENRPLYENSLALNYCPSGILQNWHTGIIAGTEEHNLENSIKRLEKELDRQLNSLVYWISKAIYFAVLAFVVCSIVQFYTGRLSILDQIDI